MPTRLHQHPTDTAVAQLLDSAETLAVFGFAADVLPDDPRVHAVPLAHLGGARRECWAGNSPVQAGEAGAIRYACNAELLVGQISLADDGADMEQLTDRAYAQIVDFVSGSSTPHLLRVWHFLRDINQGEADAERYRQFCVGRHPHLQRLVDHGAAYPAATVIGGDQACLQISFIAAAAPGEAVENPRQTSAFHYPRSYGPRSPSFSRAKRWPAAEQRSRLLVSGTASVVGHATAHAGEPIAQLRETLANLAVLKAEGERLHCLRIYVRHAEHWPALQAELQQAGYGPQDYIALRGDICRSDLLVEIEAIVSR